MMPADINVADWDDQTVLLTLQHITHRLVADIPEAEQAVVDTEQDAGEALAAFAGARQGETVSAERIIAASDAAAVARTLLVELAQDPDVGPQVSDLINDPPRPDQMSGIELMAQSAIVLGLLVSWLQTKVEISVEKKEGPLKWSFRLRKNEADSAVITKIAQRVLGLAR